MANTTSKSKEPDVQGSAGSSVLGFHRLKTRNKILVGFAVPVCFVVIIAVIVHRSIGALIETAGSVQHTQTVISGGQELLRLMIDMETGERGFLITGKNEFLQPFTDAQELWNERILTLRNLVSDNPAQVQRLDRIDNLEKQWLEEAAAVEISKRRSVQIGNKSLAYMQDTLRRGVGKNILDGIRANLDRMTTRVFESGNQYAANLLLAIAKDIVDQETGQRGFLITGDESFLEPYLSGQRSFNRNVSDFRRVVESAYRKQDILNEIAALQKLPERWLVEAATQEIQLKRELLASSSSSSSSSNFGTIEERLSRGTGKSILDSMRSVMSAMNRDFELARNLSAQTLVGLIIKDLVDQETGQRGFLLTGKDEFLRPFEIGQQNVVVHINELIALIEKSFDRAEMISQLDTVVTMTEQWRREAADVEITARREISESGVSTLEFLQTVLSRNVGKDIHDEMRTLLASLELEFEESDDLRSLFLVAKIGKAMVDQETGERGFLITGVDSFLQPFDQGSIDFAATTAKLRVHVTTAYDASTRQSILDDIDSVQTLGRKWQEQAAQPEIASRRRINERSVNTLQFIQTVLLRARGKNILDEIRVIFDDLNATFDQSNHLQGIGLVLELGKAVVDQETGERGFLITGDDEFLQPYESGKYNFRSTIPKLKNLIDSYYDVDAVQSDIDSLEDLAVKWRKEAAEPEIELRYQVLIGDATMLQIETLLGQAHGKNLLDDVRARLEDLDRTFAKADAESGRYLVASIATDIVNQETGQRGFLITGQDPFLQPYRAGTLALTQHFTELRALVATV